jgi:Lipocalin-like domain
MQITPTQSNLLIGTWRLLSAIAIYSDGTMNSEVYGADPTGYITYTVQGHMMVMFSRSDRSRFSKDIQSPLSREIQFLSMEECAQAFATFNAYAGTYTVEGNTVTHQIEVASIPNRVGTTLVRTFTLNEDQVTLNTQPAFDDGIETVFELVWKRV